MDSAANMCLECLQRRIEVDFSGRLNFVHGLSNYPLPFGSEAVVQVSDSDQVTPQQFVLNYVPYRQHDCFARYIGEFCAVDGSGEDNGESSTTKQVQAEVSVGICSDRSSALDIASTECQHFSDSGSGRTIGCEKCKISNRFSCSRVITSLAPIARIGPASYELFDELASSFSSGSFEDQLLQSLCLLIEGKSAGRDSSNFINLLGLPSFNENGFPGCIRHPNIIPILGMLKSPTNICMVLPKTPYTLESTMHFSPAALQSDWHIRFLIYQLLSALSYMHGLGIAHGNLRPSNIMLTDTSWCWLQIGEEQLLKSAVNPIDESPDPSAGGFCFECCSSRALYADMSLSNSDNWQCCFYRWWKGELSNFEYLLILNRLAGRRWGDHTFYTVMPWVMDFSVKYDESSNSGWRDLSKSKWRLAKGDEQLDFTYSTSEIPHHVSDECLSELAVCSYKARRLPLSVLRLAVRSVYEPNEYPSSMQRLYQWTPDECIPEFYSDPRIFYSLHSGMPDLAVPSWAATPEEFIRLHRDALESNRVSSQIHHWIDITFGYKMSGEAAISAKNVTLPASTSTIPRSTGRRQLFSQPHPQRLNAGNRTCHSNNGQTEIDSVEGGHLLVKTNHITKLEEATSFCEKSWHLSPSYSVHSGNYLENDTNENQLLADTSGNISPTKPDITRNCSQKSTIDSNFLLENMEADRYSIGYQELMLWSQTCYSKITSKRAANDIFAIGCILSELHVGKPLFGPSSLASYLDSGFLPSSVQDLPHHMKVIVKACIQRDWNRRPSTKCLLESPYFPKSVKSSYYFLASFHLLSRNDLRLQYAATFAKQGALKRMGSFAAEMCAPYCLPLVVTSASDAEAEWAYLLLTEFLKCLKAEAVMKFVVPSVQRIMQATNYSHLKVSLLQGSFMQELWNRIGKQAYFEIIHQLIISNLCISPHKSSSSAASVLLIGSSEELGVPVTVHQTILPLMLSFGKGICSDGIDVLIRIGGLIGEKFIVKQILPLLYTVVDSCISTLNVIKPEPIQSWGSSALIDCLTAIDGLVPVLTTETIVKELIEERNCPYIKIIMQREIGIQLHENAAKSLIRVCQQIGPDSTALHVLPKLKELFDEFAFSQKKNTYSVNLIGNMLGPKVKVGEEDCIESRMDLVVLLYPQFALLLGIERLRQCCATWLLIEQFLLRNHNWRWENAGDSYRSFSDSLNGRRLSQKSSTSENMPAKLLLNGVGWSRPQSQGKKSTKNLMPSKNMYDFYQNPAERLGATSSLGMQEPWYWFPSPASNWNGIDFTTRAGGLKDELPWKIKASIIQSVRAHHGALRSFAVCQDESTVFTAGVGQGFKGNIQKWDLSRVDCMSSYNGHDEVVNDIFDLASSGRVASCDGTVHIWNGQTGKLISIFSERSLASTQLMERDEENMLHFNPLPSGMLSTAFHGNSYTTMDYLGFNDRLIVGTGNGSLRFIDVNQGQKLHLWRSESIDSGFPPLISSICSSSSAKMRPEGTIAFPSWIAAATSTGYCRLFDLRSGKIISSWQAHDGYVTKLAATADHQLVSSSLDKTLRIWDLRRNWSAEQTVFRGYSDGVSGFSVWGQNIISVCRNKIGLSSLQSPADEDGQHRASLQHVYMADGESKNVSVLSAISILPFSRLFLLGTEDGYLKICC